MRLIDADALLAEAKRLSGPQTGDGWDNWGVYALIERQPTIEPKRGRWIIGDNGEWACSECGYEPVVFENTPFCANCSARMCDAKKKEGRA